MPPFFHMTLFWFPWRCLFPISVLMDLAYRCSFSSSCPFALFHCHFFGRLESCLISLYLLPVASGIGWLSLLAFFPFTFFMGLVLYDVFHLFSRAKTRVPAPIPFYFSNLYTVVSSSRNLYDSWLFHTTALAHITLASIYPFDRRGEAALWGADVYFYYLLDILCL